MEIKQKNVAGVRALFDRILAMRLSSSKFSFSSSPPGHLADHLDPIEKGKSVFKKWLAFEKEQGDAAGMENVKIKARAFVESRQDGQDD
jgi:rRNA biogenesis protein RRP5